MKKAKCSKCGITFYRRDNRHKLCALHRFMRKFKAADATGQRRMLDNLGMR